MSEMFKSHSFFFDFHTLFSRNLLENNLPTKTISEAFYFYHQKNSLSQKQKNTLNY
jgi:hypothetical protein